MVVGAVVVFIWGSNEALHNMLYEIVPGFVLAFIVTIVVSLLTYKKNNAIDEEFDETVRILKEESR